MITPSKPASVIDSRAHPSVKRIRLLRLRDERERTGLFYIEGLRFVSLAVDQRAPIEALVVCRPLLVHAFAQKLVRQQRRIGTPVLEVTPAVLHSISLVEDSPGNLGTILRTSDAVGGAGVIALSDAIDPYDPAAVRATMGAMFTQHFVRTNIAEFASWKRRSSFVFVGTSPTAATDYHAIAYRGPAILCMGEERKGLSSDLQALCDIIVRIPMVGRSDSLNLAVATGVLLYELFNQRRNQGLL